jgi:hypothetical protein
VAIVADLDGRVLKVNDRATEFSTMVHPRKGAAFSTGYAGKSPGRPNSPGCCKPETCMTCRRCCSVGMTSRLTR